MKDNSQNIILIKSKKFAIRSIRVADYLNKTCRQYVIAHQYMKCSTSIGANVKEAIRGQSKADFGAKMNIALKEASEAEYWIEIMIEAKLIPENKIEDLLLECREIIKILTSIVKTTFTK